MAFDVGEMKGKHTNTTAPDFFPGTHLFPVLCKSVSCGKETLPASERLLFMTETRWWIR